LTKRRNFQEYIALRPLSITLYTVVFGLGTMASGSAQVVPVHPLITVSPEHWCYRFLERFEAKGALSGLGDGIKPLTRGQVSEAVWKLSAVVDSGLEISAVETAHLRLLLREFPTEDAGSNPKRLGVAGDRIRRAPPLAVYRHEHGSMEADLLARSQSDVLSGRGRGSSERVYRNRLGGIVRGRIEDIMGFRISFEQAREEGSRRYGQRDDVFEPRLEVPQLKGDRVDYHEGTAYIAFGTRLFDVQFGKDVASWGPAGADNLGLTNNAPSFDMVRLSTHWGAFKLVSIAGFLRPCPDRPDSPLCSGASDSTASYIVNNISRSLDREKYLAAHRVEITLAPWIDLGFQELVVYGDRGPELSYLNPIMFYWAAQSYLGDKDNLMMGLDLDLHPGNGVRLYLAYLADDLKKLRLFSNDFANKFSVQSGLLWVDPFGFRDGELRADYVRIEPWIFTHKFPINTFRHFDAPLGHSLGPNSDRWSVSAAHDFTRDLALRLELSRTRHGDNELLPNGQILNLGGDLHYGWRPGDERKTKSFLQGTPSKWTTLGTVVDLRVWPHLDVTLSYHLEWGTNVPLPPRWDPNIALTQRSGYGDGRQQHLALDVRYNLL
jgi:hypothetical protein